MTSLTVTDLALVAAFWAAVLLEITVARGWIHGLGRRDERFRTAALLGLSHENR